jgi:2-iminobutanoate/2-iminopropanoate deaminase
MDYKTQEVVMEKRIISTLKAPSAIGPYSQAVAVGNIIYTSGQIPVDPSTGEVVSGDITKATARCIENIRAIAESEGCTLDDVIKTTLFIKDMNQFPLINGAYAEYFKYNMPARSCVEVARLPKDVGIEIEAVILKK